MPDKITVLLVDDHSLVRRGFRRILEDDPDIVVVGEASDGDEAIRLARKLQPRVVVMDCALPGTSGLLATRRILEISPEVAVLMLSMHSEDTWVRQALEAGARGYILKNAVDLELATAIKRVVAGETVLDPQVSRPAALKGERDCGLTVRELEILQLIVDGKSNKEIAAQLDLSVNTEVELSRNLFVGFSVDDQLQNLELAHSKSAISLPFQNRWAGHLGIEHGLTCYHSLDCRCQLQVHSILQNVTARASFKCLPHPRIFGMHAQHQNRDFGRDLENTARCEQSARARQRAVHHDYPWL